MPDSRREAVTEFATVDPEGPEAAWCLERYYEELAARFVEAFDPASQPAPKRRDFSAPAGAFVVARRLEEIVGCGALKTLSPGVALVTRMWVRPRARRGGLGAAILETLEARARELGIPSVRLDTNQVLSEAQALYRKHGYREVPRFTHHPHAHFWFEKKL